MTAAGDQASIVPPGDAPGGTGGSGSSAPAGSGPTRPASGSRQLLVAGWALYILSWITPSVDGRQFGAVAFVESVRFGWSLLTTDSILSGLAVMLGWLANFSILKRRLPNSLRIVATLAPWLAFAVVLAQ